MYQLGKKNKLVSPYCCRHGHVDEASSQHLGNIFMLSFFLLYLLCLLQKKSISLKEVASRKVYLCLTKAWKPSKTSHLSLLLIFPFLKMHPLPLLQQLRIPTKTLKIHILHFILCNPSTQKLVILCISSPPFTDIEFILMLKHSYSLGNTTDMLSKVRTGL